MNVAPMDEPPKQPHGIGWYAAWIVLALVLYVASIGPASGLLVAYGRYCPQLAEGCFMWFYSPLQIVLPRNAEPFVVWWMNWWTALLS